MVKEKVTYVDYDGNERTEDFYFNLDQAEALELEVSKTGGLTAYAQQIAQSKDMKELVAIFKELLSLSYGEKSLDGRMFIKNEEVLSKFKQCPAYSKLFMKYATDDKAAANFFNNVSDTKNAIKLPDQPLAKAPLAISQSQSEEN